MDVKKFQLAMRPKKYLTHDFIVYQDPSMQAARSEMQAGGIVEREGFAKGPPNPKGRSDDLLTGRGADDLIDAFIKAHAKDDISFLFQKTASNPNGVLDKEGLKALSKVINNPKGLEKFVEKTKLDADTIYDMLDEREAFKNLDLESAMKKSSTAGTRQEIKTILSNGEDWLIKNSKNYDTVKDLKKGFKRVFGKNHPFLKEALTFTEDNLTKFRPLFFEDIKLTKTPGATPSYKLQKYSLDQIFNASLYNFNPEVRDEVLNDLNDILSQKVTTKTKGDIRNQFLKNKRLTELGINKRLQGPITRLLMKDINEDIVENLKFIKQPIRGTPNLLNYLKDKVDPKYRKQFDLASKAITQIQAKKYDGAKETLKIAENINFDHKVPQSVIELGYADEIEFAKVNPVGEDFNQNIKRTQFDSKINRLVKVYEATPDKDKPKIIKKMNAVKDSFNKRYNNYLGDVTIKQVDGKLNFSSKAKVFKTSADITKALQNNFKQNPQLFQLAESAYGGVCRVKKSTGGRVPGEDYNTCIARNLSETIGDATDVSDKAKSGKAINKLSELTNVAKAAKYGKNALRGLQAILIGTGVGEIALTAALEGLGPIEGAVEGEDLTRIISRAPLVNLALNAFGFEDFSEENLKKIVYGSGLEGAELAGAEKLVKQFDRANTLSDLFGKRQRTLDYENLLIDEGTGYVGMMNDKIAEIDKQIQQTSEDFGRPENQIKRDDVLFLKKGIENYASKSADRVQSSYLGKTGTSGYGAMGEQPYILGDTEFVGDEFFPTKSREQIKAELQQKRTADVLENRAGFGFMGDIIGDVAGPGKADLSLQETFQYDPNAILGYSGGGVVKRKGFANGPKIGRRGFLGMLAAVVASLKVGSFGKTGKKVTSEVAKKVIKDAPTGTPDWFAPLVDKVFREGVDAGETMKTVTGRETVKKLEVVNPETNTKETYFLFENPDTGEIRIDIDAPFLGANDGEFSLYMRPNKIDGINDDGTPMMDEGEFFVTEERAVGRMNGPDDFDIELETIDTDLSGSASDYHRVEEFATGKTNKKAQEEQLKKKDYIERNPGDDIESRYGPFNDTPPDDDY